VDLCQRTQRTPNYIRSRDVTLLGWFHRQCLLFHRISPRSSPPFPWIEVSLQCFHRNVLGPYCGPFSADTLFSQLHPEIEHYIDDISEDHNGSCDNLSKCLAPCTRPPNSIYCPWSFCTWFFAYNRTFHLSISLQSVLHRYSSSQPLLRMIGTWKVFHSRNAIGKALKNTSYMQVKIAWWIAFLDLKPECFIL